MAHKASKGKKVGSDYAETRYECPWNAGVDSWYGNEKNKSIYSPAKSTWDPDIKIHDGYDSLWSGKK